MIFQLVNKKTEILAIVTSNQARSKEFALGGGCFGGWKQHQTILTQILIGLHLDWVGFSIQIQVIPPPKKKIFTAIETVFLSKVKWSLKKKGLHPGWNPLFWTISHQVLHQFSSPIPLGGGAIFVFNSKIGLKNAKNRVTYFAYSSGQWGKLEPPTHPLATLLPPSPTWPIYTTSTIMILHCQLISMT